MPIYSLTCRPFSGANFTKEVQQEHLIKQILQIFNPGLYLLVAIACASQMSIIIISSYHTCTVCITTTNKRCLCIVDQGVIRTSETVVYLQLPCFCIYPVRVTIIQESLIIIYRPSYFMDMMPYDCIVCMFMMRNCLATHLVKFS